MLQKIQILASEAQRTLRAFASPRIAEEAAAAKRRSEALPNAIRTLPHQILGTHSAGCSATYGIMERCDFACTACYLSNKANQTPPLPFEEVKDQLDQVRDYLGPWGNLQLTAGEVTLLPVEDMLRIVKYASEVELSAMLMTHGQNIMRNPAYLERLMIEGGLSKIAVHIDTTQRGRHGQKNSDREPDLHWIRNAFAGLVRQTRERTGRTLHASHTFTVTEDNFEDLPAVVRWCVENSDAFRMLSLQPTADVGRTRVGEQVGRQEAIWAKVCEGLGIDASPDSMAFGHPKCNTTSLNFVVKWADQLRVVEVTRADKRSRAFFNRLMTESFAGFCADGEPNHVVLARALGRIRLAPDLMWRVPSYIGYRAFTEREWFPDFLRAVATGKRWSIKPFSMVIHNFMSSHELETEEGKERLEACAFKVPVDGRMVSMCELNGTDLRETLNTHDRERLVPIREPLQKVV